MPNEMEAPDCGRQLEPDNAISEYAKALADGRVQRWHPIVTVPNNRTVIVGVAGQVGSGAGVWRMKRKTPEMNTGIFLGPHHGIVATHWCEDTLGTPHIGQLPTPVT